jgi:hypothetical protein
MSIGTFRKENEKLKIKNQYCPVISRIAAIGYDHQGVQLGMAHAKRPPK